MAVSNPRSLKELTEYRNLLNAKDDAMRVVSEALGMTQADLNTNLTITCSVNLKPSSGVGNLFSSDFNTFVAKWLVANMLTVAPDVIALMDAEIASNKAEAETEAGLLGLTSTPFTPAAPAITSSTTDTGTIGSAYTYTTTASSVSGAGITSVAYSIASAPAWLSINATTGVVSGTIPTTYTAGQTETFDVTVTTNVGSDTKTVTITMS